MESINRSGLRTGRKRARTPTVLQMEAVECGAAALAIVLGYYGRTVSLAELREACGVSRDGISASNLLKAAQRYGLVAHGYKKELEALLEEPFPYIVFWNFNHFLVVEGFRDGWFYVNDPETGPRRIAFPEFNVAYTGVVLILRPGADFQRGGHTIGYSSLLRRLQGSMGALLYCIAAGLLLVAPGIAIPVFSQIFVDRVLVQGMSEWIRPLLVGIAITAIFRALVSGLQRRYLRRLRIKLAVVESSRFIWHLLHLPMSFYAHRFAGEVGSRTRLNDRVAEAASGRLATTSIDVLMVALYAVVMLEYSVSLTLIGVAFAALDLITLRWIARRRVGASFKATQQAGQAEGVGIAGLQCMETLKASALESDFFSRWASYYARALNAQQELALTDRKLGILPPLLRTLAMLLILVMGGLKVIQGTFTIGMLVAFQSLMQSFLLPVHNLVDLGGTLQELRADLHRLDDVLEQPAVPSVDPSPLGEAVLAGSARLQGRVDLRNVTFGYSRVSPPLIEDFSLTIHPGQRVGIVGSTGSGKSTLAKLITGLYEPWSGEVLFDGLPRTAIPRDILTTSVAMVDQDIFLFEGTIRDNLTLWEPTIGRAELLNACRDAAIQGDITSIPGGYDGTLIEWAANLSGGQRQRLEIARALVNDPSIIVLDEAMSALDADTELVIDTNLRRRRCSCIILAHRISTIRDCDEILVLEAGHVVERGTHDQLKAAGGLYRRLLNDDVVAVGEA